MATPPTFVSEAETAFNSNTTPKTTGSFSVQTGDVLIACGGAEAAGNGAGGTGLVMTMSGGSLTWTSEQDVHVADYGEAQLWSATAGSNTSMTGSLATNAGGSNLWFGLNALTFRGSDGKGASSKTNVSGAAPSLSLTTTQDNSAIVVIVIDWNAVDGTTRTWRTVNSVTPTAGNGYELTYFRDSSHYVVYIAYYPDAGTAGAKTVGLSAPSGQKYSIAAIEVKGAATAGATLTGQSAALAAGTLAAATSKALSGSALASAQGTLAPALSTALTGSAAASAAGTLIPSISIALTGQALAMAQGSVSAGGDITLSLTGQVLTLSAGTLTPALSEALSGSALTAAAGTIALATSKALTGSALTSALGALAPSLSTALSGNLLAVGQGNVTAPGNVTVALTGQVLTASQGTFTLSLSKALTGSSAATSTGSVVATPSKVLTGHQLTTSSGTLDITFSVSLTGSLSSITQGTVRVGSGDPTPPASRRVTVSFSGAINIKGPDGSVTVH